MLQKLWSCAEHGCSWDVTFRQDDVEGVVNLQSKGFYEPWAVEWLDSFFLSLFAVSPGQASLLVHSSGKESLQCQRGRLAQFVVT